MTRILAAVIASGLALAAPSLQAHGDMHVQILEVTRQIEKEPANAKLYLRRGELQRTHGDWDAAQVDYDRAAALDPKLAAVDLARGKMFFAANWPLSARLALDRYLAGHTNDVEGLITRARVLAKLEQRPLAVSDYSRAIALTTEARPELFLERAQVLTAGDDAHLGEALQVLEEGIKQLGPLVTFQLYAMDIELKQKKFDAALARLDKVAAQFPRQETWLARRGEILQQAGRNDEACAAFRAALRAIAALPEARRHVPAMVELDKRVRASQETTCPPNRKPGK